MLVHFLFIALVLVLILKNYQEKFTEMIVNQYASNDKDKNNILISIEVLSNIMKTNIIYDDSCKISKNKFNKNRFGIGFEDTDDSVTLNNKILTNLNLICKHLKLDNIFKEFIKKSLKLGELKDFGYGVDKFTGAKKIYCFFNNLNIPNVALEYRNNTHTKRIYTYQPNKNKILKVVKDLVSEKIYTYFNHHFSEYIMYAYNKLDNRINTNKITSIHIVTFVKVDTIKNKLIKLIKMVNTKNINEIELYLDENIDKFVHVIAFTKSKNNNYISVYLSK